MADTVDLTAQFIWIPVQKSVAIVYGFFFNCRPVLDKPDTRRRRRYIIT